MRKFILLFFTSGFCLISYSVFTNAGGPTFGVAGEPPLNETCAVSTCHDGSALNSGGGTTTIVCKDSLNAVVTSYIPNHTYTITLSVTEGAKTRYGFEAIVMRGAGTGAKAIGTMIITSTKTQLFGPTAKKNIMHTSTGIDFGTTTGSWSFNWKAPSANNGTATVYAAFNATNNDTKSTGDHIYTKTLDITGTGPAGIVSNTALRNIRIYPNPASSQLNFDLTSTATITIYDLNGKEVKNLYASSATQLNIDDLLPGIYIARITSTNVAGTYKFIKQ